MYCDYGDMLVAGSKWKPNATYEVNKAEAAAVRLALEKFDAHLVKGTCLDLFIDNTSCQAAINRKIAKSDGIAGELVQVLDHSKRKGIRLQATYVKSQENPADPISREF